MPTLEEMRKWARGEDVKGLPKKVEEAPKPDPVASSTDLDGPVRGSSHRYVIKGDKSDALLRFGMFRGHKVSELVTTPRGRKWLRWVVDKEDFEADLRAVCRLHLEQHRRDKHGP
jgi:hypothetical protein